MTTAPRPSPLAGLALTLVALVAAGCSRAAAPTPTPPPTPAPSLASNGATARTPPPAPSLAPTVVPTPTPIVAPSQVPGSTLPPRRTPLPTPSAPPTPAASVDLPAGALPLPADLRLDQGDISVSPSSEPGMLIGVTLPFELGHCGLYSPVDLDGSLWEPVGGTDRRGGPIDTDAEVGDLVNATPGEAMLVTAQRMDWRAAASGVVVTFQRLPGPRRYPGCM